MTELQQAMSDALAELNGFAGRVFRVGGDTFTAWRVAAPVFGDTRVSETQVTQNLYETKARLSQPLKGTSVILDGKRHTVVSVEPRDLETGAFRFSIGEGRAL